MLEEVRLRRYILKDFAAFSLFIWSKFYFPLAWISSDYFESFSPLSNFVTEGVR